MEIPRASDFRAKLARSADTDVVKKTSRDRPIVIGIPKILDCLVCARAAAYPEGRLDNRDAGMYHKPMARGALP